MRKAIIAAPALLFLSACLPAQTPNQIIVDGEAVLELEPEVFSLSGSIGSNQKTQNEALAEIASRLSTIREGLPQLDGLTAVKIETSNATLEPVRDGECLEQRRYRNEDACPIIGYSGNIGVSIEGAPVSLSGNALSLLSELGAETVSLSSYTLKDKKAAEEKALASAVVDAREKAQKIAAAAGAKISGAVRIQFGEGFSGDDIAYSANVVAGEDNDTIIVTGSRLSPETALELAPAPIRVTAKVVAAFEIE